MYILNFFTQKIIYLKRLFNTLFNLITVYNVKLFCEVNITLNYLIFLIRKNIYNKQ